MIWFRYGFSKGQREFSTSWDIFFIAPLSNTYFATYTAWQDEYRIIHFARITCKKNTLGNIHIATFKFEHTSSKTNVPTHTWCQNIFLVNPYLSENDRWQPQKIIMRTLWKIATSCKIQSLENLDLKIEGGSKKEYLLVVELAE